MLAAGVCKRHTEQSDLGTRRFAIRSQPAWLSEVLSCPVCGQASLILSADAIVCGKCGAGYSAENGILYLIFPGSKESLDLQQKAWQAREKACGRYEIALEEALRLPNEAGVRTQLEWLRSGLQRRGQCRVLEIGAGRGWASRLLAEDGHEVVVSDILDDEHIGLGCAVRQRSQTGLSFACVLTGAEKLPFRSASFDCVFSFSALRHIADLQNVLHEVSRVLRPDGVFLAFAEPFRGLLTTQAQRLQDCTTHRLARCWLAGSLRGMANQDVSHPRSSLGATLHELCRRVPFCVNLADEADLQSEVLPAHILPDLPLASFDSIRIEGMPLAWLDAFAETFAIDHEQLRLRCQCIERSHGLRLEPLLLAYWILIGNVDGVLVARKKDSHQQVQPPIPDVPSEDLRRLEPVLVAAARDGMVPIYGFHAAEVCEGERYHWIQPQAGFLVAPGDFLEFTITCPPPCFRSEPVRIEVRVEDEPAPILVVLIRPGMTVALKVPLKGRHADRSTVLIRLDANVAFMPSDYTVGHGSDMRLLALQIRAVRTAPICEPLTKDALEHLRALVDASGRGGDGV
ncbi:MAG TPA: class I SAM-dependent methyltransferase [Gemmataceae bacterium]|nr:class I SAM-dependent methyltransferase [Gemmataceae bacterium]